MTIPVKEVLTIFKGGTFKHRFLFLYENDTPVDVTGYSARMHIREEWDSVTEEVNLTTENGKINTNPSLGIFDISIPATETAGLAIDAGVYDLEVMPPASQEVIKLAYGKVKVLPEATR